MKISVIIPTYNRATILKKTLENLEDQDMPLKDFEVIVIDDGSKDETASMLNAFQKETELNLITLHQKNAGQGKARNRGLKNATGKIVLLLGDDMIPASREFLTHHWEAHQKHADKEWVVLGKIDWHPAIELNDYMRWMTNGSSIFGKFGGHQFAYEKLERGEKPDYNFFYTSNISMKRKLLGEDPFDLSFSKYGWEDIELGYRLQKEKDMKMVYEKEALTFHDHPMDEEGLAKRMEFIGKSAHIIDTKYPELKKVPGFWKKCAFVLLSNPLTLLLLKVANGVTFKKLKPLVYYALSKKYFLRGIRSGYNKEN